VQVCGELGPDLLLWVGKYAWLLLWILTSEKDILLMMDQCYLLQKVDNAGCDPGVKHYFDQEKERNQHANPVLIDPLDKLHEMFTITIQDFKTNKRRL